MDRSTVRDHRCRDSNDEPAKDRRGVQLLAVSLEAFAPSMTTARPSATLHFTGDMEIWPSEVEAPAANRVEAMLSDE